MCTIPRSRASFNRRLTKLRSTLSSSATSWVVLPSAKYIQATW